MDELNKANETLSTLKNVRIIYLPPCTVAASHCLEEHLNAYSYFVADEKEAKIIQLDLLTPIKSK